MHVTQSVEQASRNRGLLPPSPRKLWPKPQQLAHKKKLLMLKMNKELLKQKETKLMRIRKQQLQPLDKLSAHKQTQNQLITPLKQIWKLLIPQEGLQRISWTQLSRPSKRHNPTPLGKSPPWSSLEVRPRLPVITEPPLRRPLSRRATGVKRPRRHLPLLM